MKRNRDGKAWLVVGPGREDNPTLGALLKVIREAAGLTVAQSADAAQLTAAYIRMVENGDKVPALGTVAKIVETYEAFVQADVEIKVEPTIEEGRGDNRVIHRPDLVIGLPGDKERFGDFAGTTVLVEFKSRVREARGSALEDAIARQLRNYMAHVEPLPTNPKNAKNRQIDSIGRIVLLLPQAPPEILVLVEALLSQAEPAVRTGHATD